MQIVTLATCRNRLDCTLAAFSDLHAQMLPSAVSLAHVIVDDGSTDGTTESVSAHYPDVEILSGGGDLFWAGGMRFGWEASVKYKKFDYLFVYNDDVRLEPSAIADLLDCSDSPDVPHIVTGSFFSEDGSQTTYGGRRRSSRWHPLKFADLVEPDGTVQLADTLNMNGALISKSALSRVGFLSDYFVHAGADFEFGLKLRKAGGFVYVAKRHIGRCNLNPATSRLPEHAQKLRDSLSQLFDQKREPFKQRLKYYSQHGGWLWPVYWVSPYVTIWFRHIYKRLSGSSHKVTSE